MRRKTENSIKSRVDDLHNWTSLCDAETMDGTDASNVLIEIHFDNKEGNTRTLYLTDT